ncbi:hypothetical protein FB451DRAFT_1186791 [Mycena latifolia]|nr:hypothetical protein FB451DRAFT_1186791 [Mycena latifolia]
MQMNIFTIFAVLYAATQTNAQTTPALSSGVTWMHTLLAAIQRTRAARVSTPRSPGSGLAGNSNHINIYSNGYPCLNTNLAFLFTSGTAPQLEILHRVEGPEPYRMASRLSPFAFAHVGGTTRAQPIYLGIRNPEPLERSSLGASAPRARAARCASGVVCAQRRDRERVQRGRPVGALFHVLPAIDFIALKEVAEQRAVLGEPTLVQPELCVLDLHDDDPVQRPVDAVFERGECAGRGPGALGQRSSEVEGGCVCALSSWRA